LSQEQPAQAGDTANNLQNVSHDALFPSEKNNKTPKVG
jgi:hypothetical protein